MAQKTREYIQYLTDAQTDRMRVRIVTDKVRVVQFTVQYEAFLSKTWHPIVRFDTAHNFSHKDLMHPDGRQDKQPLAFPDFKIALTFAIQDVKAAWRWYRKGYEAEMGK